MAIGVIANDEKNKLHLTKINKYYDSTFHISLENENEAHAIIANNIQKNSVVLDIGCAQGLIGEVLCKNSEIYGIELDKEAIKIAEKTGSYEKLYCFDITNKESQEYKNFFLNNIMFDYILFSDVLEHLLYPDQVLYEFSKKLKKNGKILISLPNIAHYDVINGLLNENFNYSEMGILDNTHIRFFTKYSFAEYIQSINNDKSNDLNFDLEIIGKTIIKPYFYNQYPKIGELISKNEQLLVLQNIFSLTKKDLNESTINLDRLLLENRINITKLIDEKLSNQEQNINDLENENKNQKDINIKLKNENNLLVQNNKELQERLDFMTNQYNYVLESNKEFQSLADGMVNSKSWKLTKPMRDFSVFVNEIKEKNRCKKNHKKSILYIVQSWININDINSTHLGGTTLHTLELIQSLKNEYNIYVLTAMDNKYALITFDDKKQTVYDLNLDVKVYRYDGYYFEFLEKINQVIDELQIDLVHIQHIINFPCDLQYIAQKTKVVVTLHDYTSICLNYFLIDKNLQYCQNAVSNKCLDCSKGLDLKTRKNAINNLFASAAKLIVPDSSVSKEIRKYYNYDKFVVIPNGIDISSFSNFKYCNKKPGKIKHVALIGGLNPHKGSNIAKQIIKNNDENIMYHLFGISNDKFFFKKHKNYKYHGEYQKKDLPKLLNDNHIDLILMLSICPESFSYVLSETIVSKIPVVALDIGAIGNRVKQMKIGSVIDYKSNYSEIITEMHKVFEEKNYSQYIENLEKAKVETIENMAKSVKEIYNNIGIDDKEKNYFLAKKSLKKYKIKYEFEVE